MGVFVPLSKAQLESLDDFAAEMDMSVGDLAINVLTERVIRLEVRTDGQSLRSRDDSRDPAL